MLTRTRHQAPGREWERESEMVVMENKNYYYWLVNSHLGWYRVFLDHIHSFIVFFVFCTLFCCFLCFVRWNHQARRVSFVFHLIFLFAATATVVASGDGGSGGGEWRLLFLFVQRAHSSAWRHRGFWHLFYVWSQNNGLAVISILIRTISSHSMKPYLTPICNNWQHRIPSITIYDKMISRKNSSD